MRRVLQIILLKPVLWIANRFSSRPVAERIFKALSELKQQIEKQPSKKGPFILFEANKGKFIVFSDQHKGAKNGADDFMLCEPNYLAALDYYNEKGFFFISLGDNEELWENRWPSVKKNNTASFEKEKKFIERNAFIKMFGNHDLAWNTDVTTGLEMGKIYGQRISVYEGAILHAKIADHAFSIFLTHGHQGDAQSDGNWFSKFFVAHIWAPLQGYLKVNPNTPAYNTTKKTLHNRIMYEWSAQQKNTLLITGHTHQPVFESLTHLERLYRRLLDAQKANNLSLIEEIKNEIRIREPQFTAVSADYLEMKPTYFNSGCCCFSDGDITGIEIEDGCIRLIKWETENEKPQRCVLEEISLEELVDSL
ncbi:MAG TPA: metallophosphoesterase [Chitinophagaceae bacterium]|jgi:predicted phosphodiesterase|nr:metallophosphoesterase [Chitinophagaceae bacterium]